MIPKKRKRERECAKDDEEKRRITVEDQLLLHSFITNVINNKGFHYML